MDRMFFAIGGAFGGLVVALGEFGAHELRDRLGETVPRLLDGRQAMRCQ